MTENIVNNPQNDYTKPNPSPDNPISHIPPQKPKLPTLTLILSVILSVVSIFCIYLFLQVRTLTLDKYPPTSTPSPIVSANNISDLKTYQNNVFSFQYDLDYTVKEMSVMNKNPEFAIVLEKDSSNIAMFNIYRKNSLYKTNDSPAHDLTADQWIYWNLYNNCVDKKLGLLSGKYCTSNPYSDNEYIFVTKYNDRFIEISGKSDNKLNIDQILSTFKFADSSPTAYTCPASGYADCMPSPDGPKSSCSDEAMKWYKANCPDFKGGAL